MADGFNRYQQQPGTGPFYYPQHNQHNAHRPLNRTGSPTNPRRPFNNDTPSPSRSPVNQSPAHSHFAMYGQGGHQGHNVMMNGGGGHQRFGMQMHKYAQNHHPHHNQQNHPHHPHQHSQGGHGINHQHNFSSGTLSNATPYTGGRVQNGGPENLQDEMEEPITESWSQQLQLAAESRQAGSPHYHARTVAKGSTAPSNQAPADEPNIEERNRPVADIISRRQGWRALDFGGQGLRALAPALFNYAFLTKLYLNHNNLEFLPPEIGRLQYLTHLDVSSNHLVYLPEEIGKLVNLETLLLFDNRVHDLPSTLGFLFRLETLGIHGNPLKEEYRVKIMKEGTRALIDALRESMEPPEPPTDRDWIVLDETTSNSSGPAPDTFTALSYNILSDIYCTTTQYGYAPQRVLDWEFRKNLILDEIRTHGADIICLQELDRHNYEEFFRPQLSYDGYKGYYAQKGRAETMGDGGAAVDGCGTFWKEKKYILLDDRHLHLGRLGANSSADVKGSSDMYNRVWGRDDIATVAFLENRLTGSRLMVVNCHLYWNPAFKDVKLIQVAILMDELARLAENYTKWKPCENKKMFRFSDDEDASEALPEPGPSQEYETGTQIPLLLCGDFNSNAASAVYELLARGTLPKEHADISGKSYGKYSRLGMAHPFALRSAYGAIGELSFTNYTPGFTDAIDYIWFSSNALKVTALLGEVDPEYLKKVPGFPNYHFPSDHLALLAEFQVKGRKGKVVEADFGSQKKSSAT